MEMAAMEMKALSGAFFSLALLVSTPHAQETFRCLERIRSNQALTESERKNFLVWVDMAGYPPKERNIGKLHPLFGKYPSFSIEIIKCVMDTRYGGGLDEEKYGILHGLTDELKAMIIEYAIALYKDGIRSELSRFVDCWGKLLLELDSSGFKTALLMDSAKFTGYNERLLRNAILGNYGVKLDTAAELEKTRRAYEDEFRTQQGWYDTTRDVPTMVGFYRKVGRGQKVKESEIPFIFIP